MRAVKKGLSVFLVCIMILSSAPLAGFVGIELPEIDFGKIFDVKAGAAEFVESGSWGENVTYTLDSDGLLTISGTGNMLLDYEYAPWYPNRTAIKEVIIEDGVTNISDYAFLGCTELVSITIPESVKWIGWLSFDSCTSLDAVYISDIAAWCNIYFHYDFENPLYCANNLYLNGELVTELIIPETVTTIQPYAFNGCTSLISATIPSSVTRIEMGAFGGCSSLEEIIIENKDCQIDNSAETIPSIATIYGYAGSFANAYAKENGCTFVFLDAIAEEIIDAGVCGESVAWILTSDEILTISGTGAMNNYSLSSVPWNENCENIKKVFIEEGITNIGNCAFSNCSSLTNVTIPDSVTNIGADAFYRCSSLKLVAIPEGVTSIGNYAFYWCSSLTSLTIPNSVTTIGDYAFYWCISLTTVTIPESVVSIGDRAFDDCGWLGEIIIENKDCVLYDNNTVSSNAVIRGYVDSTAEQYAEEYDRTFISIGGNANDVIASGYCGENADWELSRNGTLFITGTGDMYNYTPVSSVPWYKYRGFIKAVHLADTITTIGQYAFNEFFNLSSIEIPNSVNNIEMYAFYNCFSLTTIFIPNSVKNIGHSAFSKCSSLSFVEFDINSRLTSIDNQVFYNCKSLYSITIPNSVTEIWGSAFNNCTSLTSIVIPKNVKNIYSYAFSGCSALTSITILNPNCSIADSGDTISVTATIIGYDNSTAKAYARKYNRTFEIFNCTHENTVKIPAVAATCTKTGLSVGAKCTLCQTIVQKPEITNVLGHSWDDGVVTTEPTVDAEGIMTYTCSACGATKTEPIEKLQPAFTECADAVLTEDGNICANIGKTAEALFAQASDGATLVDKDGNALSADDVIGTGAVLILADGTEYEIIVPGDTNGDAQITAADARFALRYSVGLETLPADSVFVLAADVDINAGIAASDARSILRASVGLDNPDAWFEKIA